MSKIRVGIDVGGTFTHAVAIDNGTLEILAYALTPTTHQAKEGVAAGVVEAFRMLLEKLKQPGDIIFVAHSTTQATNALLEGDVSPVCIIALGSGMEGMKTKSDANIPSIEVAPGRFIQSSFHYLDVSGQWHKDADALIEALAETESVVAAEAFSVDDPTNENYVKETAARRKIAACGTFEMSGLYGLRVRTKTAVINASILPKMMQTATLTRDGLQKAKVHAPLMVMRSDGGVMSIEEMMRRPLLTLLSGPAAGIAAALTYIRATDAVFLETGGTSTDITVVKNGRAMIRSAQIGGHTTYMKTLDCRTLGIAGGSMVQYSDGKMTATGPRSAHIAGLPYCCFADPSCFEGELSVTTVVPLKGDPSYLAIVNTRGEKFALTTTCAANYLGFIKEGDYAFGKKENVQKVFSVLSGHMGCSEEEAARKILQFAVDMVSKTVKELIRDYELSDKQLRLIGGGGGCAAIVPALAKHMKLDYEIASHAEVVSAIGAAMAMIRETIERNIFSPKPEEIEQVKREAVDAVIAMGANADSVEVHVEVDGQKNIVRAIATGAIEFKSQDLLESDIGEEARVKIIAQLFERFNPEITLTMSSHYLFVYEVRFSKGSLFNLIKVKKRTVLLSDAKGTIKLQLPEAAVYVFSAKDAFENLPSILERHRQYGDAGAITPGLYVVVGRRIADFTAIGDEERILSLARKEIENCDGDICLLIP